MMDNEHALMLYDFSLGKYTVRQWKRQVEHKHGYVIFTRKPDYGSVRNDKIIATNSDGDIVGVWDTWQQLGTVFSRMEN